MLEDFFLILEKNMLQKQNNDKKKIGYQAFLCLIISAASGILILLGIYMLKGDSFFQHANTLLVIFFYVAVLLYQFQISVYRSQIRPNMVILISSIQSILALIMPLFFIFYFGSKVKYIILGLSIAYLVPNIKNLLFKIFSIQRILQFKKASYSLLFELFKFGWPLSIWLTISMALQFFDRYFINYYYTYSRFCIFLFRYEEI